MKRSHLLAALLFAFASVAGSAVGCSDQTINSSSGGGGGGGGDDDGGASSDGAKGDDGGTASGDGGGKGPAGPSTNVKIIVEPSDNGSALISAIQNAKKSVHVAMYILTDTGVINALVAQKKAGHDVQVLLNKTFPSGGNANYSAYGTLHNAGIDVRYAPAVYTYSHEKVVLIDGTDAWIMTMNTADSAPSTNREYLAIDKDTDDYAEAEAVFQADYGNTAIQPQGKLLVAPATARDRIAALIDGAQKSLDIEGEELSDDDLTARIAKRADAKVPVRIVLNGDQAPTAAQAQSIATLKQHGVQLKTLKTPDMHAKAIIADGASLYVGSANFTYYSLNQNREVALITNAASEVAKVATVIGQDFGAGTAL